MATLVVLRETLRSQLGDLSRLVSERAFTAQYLSEALYEALREHDKTLSWASLPVESEQLVLLLAKARIARDKALEYALNAKVSVGASLAQDLTTNASILDSLARSYREEYLDQRTALEAADSLSGDIIVGTLVRDGAAFGMPKSPRQAVAPPPAAQLLSVSYAYNANTAVNIPDGAGASTKGGKVVLTWNPLVVSDLAYLRFYASRTAQTPLDTWTVLRTLYDTQPDFGGAPSLLVPNQAQPAAQYLEHEITLLPTGPWFFTMVCVNWNNLSSRSNTLKLDISNYLDLIADCYLLES